MKISRKQVIVSLLLLFMTHFSESLFSLQRLYDGEQIALKVVGGGHRGHGKFVNQHGGSARPNGSGINYNTILTVYRPGNGKVVGFRFKKGGLLVNNEGHNDTLAATGRGWGSWEQFYIGHDGGNINLRSKRACDHYKTWNKFVRFKYARDKSTSFSGAWQLEAYGHHGNRMAFKIYRVPRKPPFKSDDVVAIKSLTALKYLQTEGENLRVTKDKATSTALFKIDEAGNWVGFESLTTNRMVQTHGKSGVVKANTDNFGSWEKYELVEYKASPLEKQAAGKGKFFYIRNKSTDSYLTVQKDGSILARSKNEWKRRREAVFIIEKVTDIVTLEQEQEEALGKAKKDAKRAKQEAARIKAEAEKAVDTAKTEADLKVAEIKKETAIAKKEVADVKAKIVKKDARISKFEKRIKKLRKKFRKCKREKKKLKKKKTKQKRKTKRIKRKEKRRKRKRSVHALEKKGKKAKTVKKKRKKRRGKKRKKKAKKKKRKKRRKKRRKKKSIKKEEESTKEVEKDVEQKREQKEEQPQEKSVKKPKKKGLRKIIRREIKKKVKTEALKTK